MDKSERETLRELLTDATLEGESATEGKILKRLYDDPRIHYMTITLEVSDPLMQLDELRDRVGTEREKKLMRGAARLVVTEMMSELSPEWFSRRGGADWWISKYSYTDTGECSPEYEHVRPAEPFPDPKPTNPHFGHTIQVLTEGQQWFTTDANGEPEEVYEVASQNILHWYCVDCDEESRDRITP